MSSFVSTILNTYAILFFSQNKVLGWLLLLVSFLNIDAGIAGLFSVLLSIALATLIGYPQDNIKTGMYSFNSLLLGIGFGTFFHFNPAFWVWLSTSVLITLMLTVILISRLGKLGLPVLSLPFILGFWVMLLAANGFAGIGLDQRNSALLNEMSNAGTQHLTGVIDLFKYVKLPFYPDLFFRSLSAVLFQNNVLTGAVIALGILIHSRIALSLMVLGFATACLFNHFTGTFPEGISYYHMGSNLMMVAGAIGSFFLIPSVRSYIWAAVSIVITVLLVNALTHLLSIVNLPIFSLPFCAVTLLLLNFFMLRTQPGKLQLTVLQHYSPEVNLYQFLNGYERLQDLKYTRISLPFLGAWRVSQGYNGSITHKDDWSKAIDFVIHDEDGQSYREPGSKAEHFYCFNKPVLACADGIVEEAVSHIEDNEINEVNTQQNWGNSVVIKHYTGLYSKVSHLKKNSVKVKPGDFVKQGDVIGLCGNSGRSPEPHLHFQMQTTAYVGSKTFEYPFAYYLSIGGKNQSQFQSFAVPEEGELVSQVEINSQLKQAFSLQPGFGTVIKSEDGVEEVWEVHTDALNQSYIYCKTTGATAYFINNGITFYFTGYYGAKSTLLYYFYLVAYKVLLTAEGELGAEDKFPLQLGSATIDFWLHDLFAPFYQFVVRRYQSKTVYHNGEYVVSSSERREVFGKRQQVMEASLQIAGNVLKGFTIHLNGKKIIAKWCTEDIH